MAVSFLQQRSTRNKAIQVARVIGVKLDLHHVFGTHVWLTLCARSAQISRIGVHNRFRKYSRQRRVAKDVARTLEIAEPAIAIGGQDAALTSGSITVPGNFRSADRTIGVGVPH